MKKIIGFIMAASSVSAIDASYKIDEILRMNGQSVTPSEKGECVAPAAIAYTLGVAQGIITSEEVKQQLSDAGLGIQAEDNLKLFQRLNELGKFKSGFFVSEMLNINEAGKKIIESQESAVVSVDFTDQTGTSTAINDLLGDSVVTANKISSSTVYSMLSYLTLSDEWEGRYQGIKCILTDQGRLFVFDENTLFRYRSLENDKLLANLDSDQCFYKTRSRRVKSDRGSFFAELNDKTFKIINENSETSEKVSMSCEFFSADDADCHYLQKDGNSYFALSANKTFFIFGYSTVQSNPCPIINKAIIDELMSSSQRRINFIIPCFKINYATNILDSFKTICPDFFKGSYGTRLIEGESGATDFQQMVSLAVNKTGYSSATFTKFERSYCGHSGEIISVRLFGSFSFMVIDATTKLPLLSGRYAGIPPKMRELLS